VSSRVTSTAASLFRSFRGAASLQVQGHSVRDFYRGSTNRREKVFRLRSAICNLEMRTTFDAKVGPIAVHAEEIKSIALSCRRNYCRNASGKMPYLNRVRLSLLPPLSLFLSRLSRQFPTQRDRTGIDITDRIVSRFNATSNVCHKSNAKGINVHCNERGNINLPASW